MNHPLFYTPEEAERAIRKYGEHGPSAEAIRAAAVQKPRTLGFPVTVIGTRVYIPKAAFNEFWGIKDA